MTQLYYIVNRYIESAGVPYLRPLIRAYSSRMGLVSPLSGYVSELRSARVGLASAA